MADNIKLASEVTFLQAAEGDAAPGPKRFRIVAYTGAPIRQAWSREPVVIDLAGMTLPSTIPIVMGHDYSLGSILGQGRPSVQGGQLVVEGEILADSETARQVLALAAAGYEWQASVGADVGRHLRFGEDQATTANGTRHITLSKRLEHPGVVLLWNAGAIIGKAQAHPVPVVLELGMQAARPITLRVA